jgi:hypothetical protein
LLLLATNPDTVPVALPIYVCPLLQSSRETKHATSGTGHDYIRQQKEFLVGLNMPTGGFLGIPVLDQYLFCHLTGILLLYSWLLDYWECPLCYLTKLLLFYS